MLCNVEESRKEKHAKIDMAEQPVRNEMMKLL